MSNNGNVSDLCLPTTTPPQLTPFLVPVYLRSGHQMANQKPPQGQRRSRRTRHLERDPESAIPVYTRLLDSPIHALRFTRMSRLV
jgi:hypothetical protein